MVRYKIVAITDDVNRNYDVEKEILQKIDAELHVSECKTVSDVIEACRDADGIMTEYAPITAEVVAHLKRCKIISRYGVGYDNVDVDACTRRGIYVANVPDYCAEEVSDHALALMMTCLRQIVYRDRLVRSGGWNITGDPIRRIAGMVFSFLGFGTIARCLLRKIKGLEFSRILVYDPYVEAGVIRSLGAEQVDLETALKQADCISIHMPLNDDTHGLIGAEAFALMKSSAVLINTSRGSIINEESLVKAIQDKVIGCVGLDVYEYEPLAVDHPLKALDNCVLTDHIGWYSEEAKIDLKRKVAENIRDVLEGKPPKYAVNDICTQ
jgi:D-3-phosphoglycerate dehydrogenase